MSQTLHVAVLGDGAAPLAAALGPRLPADVQLHPVPIPRASIPRASLVLLVVPPADAGATAKAADTAWRLALTACTAPWAALHGLPNEQLNRARAAIERLRHPPSPGLGTAWVCGECSDPDCEHRLFRRLLRETDAPGP